MLRTTFPKAGDHVSDHAVLHRHSNALVWADDFASIQAAIDNAPAGGTVYLPDGAYPISQTIQCKPGVSLELSNGATLQAAADVDLIQCKPQAHIRGGRIDCYSIPYAHSAFVLDGKDLYQLWDVTRIQNIILTGSGGKAFYMHAEESDAPRYVFGVDVSSIGVFGFDYVIHMRTEEAMGQWAGVSANLFSNISMQAFKYGIYMECIGDKNVNLTGVGGNLFSNIQLQASEDSINALYCDGGSNHFTNFFVWDWPPAETAIRLTERSSRNVINTNLFPQYMTDAGTTNKVITPDA